MVGSPTRVAYYADDPCRLREWSRPSTELKGQILGAITRWGTARPPGHRGADRTQAPVASLTETHESKRCRVRRSVKHILKSTLDNLCVRPKQLQRPNGRDRGTARP